MCSSKTQEAKNLYEEMCQVRGALLTPGLYIHNATEWHWVTKNGRAYKLSDMSTEHLVRTIQALKERHPEEPRKRLEDELQKRTAEFEEQHKKNYTVWVGGGEINSNLVTRNVAQRIADAYKEDGYEDVVITKVLASRPIQIYQTLIEKNWDWTLGVLDDRKVNLLLENLKAMHEANLEEDIKHIINVWKECGIQ